MSINKNTIYGAISSLCASLIYLVFKIPELGNIPTKQMFITTLMCLAISLCVSLLFAYESKPNKMRFDNNDK